jgi:hypothetical protein
MDLRIEFLFSLSQTLVLLLHAASLPASYDVTPRLQSLLALQVTLNHLK